MVEYSFKDTKRLVYAIFEYFKTEDLNILKDWLEVFYVELKDHRGDIKETIIEIMGPYFTGSPTKSKKTEEIIDLIFNKPLSDMLLYLESDMIWQTVVAQWRLTINK